MTGLQRTIKYAAIALAVLLTVSIVGGIGSALAGVATLFDGDNKAAGEMETYDITGEITALSIDVGGAALTVTAGDTWALSANHRYLTVEVKDGRLTAVEEKKSFINYTDVAIELCIPADTQLDEVSIHTGAGRVTVDRLCADTLELDFGAGEVTIGELEASREATIDGGAGKITVRDGALRDLDLDMGVGALELTAALTGDSELSLGVGETRLTLLGAAADYAVSLDKGLGEATLDGKPMRNEENYGTGPSRVDIDGGIGAIKVTFAE